MRTYEICMGVAVLAVAPAACGVEPSGSPQDGLGQVSQAVAATWGNPVINDGDYGSDCRPTGVVDAGDYAGEHYFVFYGDFRCGHSESFPTPIYSWQCGINGTTVTGRTTFTGTFQVNSAFMVPSDPWARCFVTISSWNHVAGLYEIIL